MKFTFQNVWENRDAFIEACRYANACKTQFNRLIKAETKNEFMQVVCDNFYWINMSIKNFKPKVDNVYSWDKGFALVKLKGKYGFINNNGSYLIEPNFKDAGCFSEGFARVKVNEKWGFIKTDGSYLIEPKFDAVIDFHYGFAVVRLKDKYGYIKEDGICLAPIYDYAGSFSGGLARVKLDGKHYNLDTNGNLKEIK